MSAGDKTGVRRLAFCGLLTALSAAFLTVGRFTPAMLAFSAAASFVLVPAVAECGVRGGAAVWLCAGTAAFLAGAWKETFWFALFGFWVLFKALAERPRRKAVGFLLKFGLFNGVLAVLRIFAREIPFSRLDPGDFAARIGSLGFFAAVAIGNAALLVYDWALTGFLRYYVRHLHGRLESFFHSRGV